MKIVKRIKKLLGRDSKNDAEGLRKAGARIGKNFCGYATIDMPHVYLLTIGDDVTLSNCQILLHDASTKRVLGYTKIGRVEIGNNVFVGSNALIMPNVKIGSNVVVGARSVVTKDIPDNSIVAGCPAKVIGSYEDYIIKMKESFENSENVFNTHYSQKTAEQKQKEYEALKDGGFGFDI